MYKPDTVIAVQNYIYENLTDTLTLDGIAEQMHFSPYWLSKLYHRQTGETVMEHVRKQRMRMAAYELLYTRCDIIGVALKFGYDTPDGFSRAFKMHYGMTPMKYKQSGRQIQADSSINKSREEKSNMYEYWMYEKLHCTREEKKEVFTLIDELLQLSTKAKQVGLFELEHEVNLVSETLLKKGLELMIDGTEPEILKKILLNHLSCGNKQAKEFLKGILIIEGILCIQQGWHPYLIKEILLSYLGEEMIADTETHYNTSSKYRSDLIKGYIDELSQKEVSESARNLEGPLEKINDRSLQRLLRDLDYEMVAIVLNELNKKTQEKVLNNMSPRLAVMIIENIKNLKRTSSADIIEAQKSMLEIIKLLVKEGEIVI